MKYTTYNVQQIVREGRKGKPWQARAKYKDTNGKWKEVSTRVRFCIHFFLFPFPVMSLARCCPM